MTRFTYSAGSRALTRARDKFTNVVASNPEGGDVLISLGFQINTLELSPFACTMGKSSVGLRQDGLTSSEESREGAGYKQRRTVQ